MGEERSVIGPWLPVAVALASVAIGSAVCSFCDFDELEQISDGQLSLDEVLILPVRYLARRGCGT